jgi:exonuclease III
MAAQISFVSYNLHGFRQGCECIRDLCLTNDVILIQEHWLCSEALHKLQINDNFRLIAHSSMDDTCGRGPLVGRPFGGLAIFVRNGIFDVIKLIACGDRFILVKLNNLLVCNVYFPVGTSPATDGQLILCDTLASILNELGNVNYSDLIVAGDLNCSFTRSSYNTTAILEFCDSMHISPTFNLMSSDDQFTFRDSRGLATSLIDHFLISDHLMKKIESVSTCDSGSNFSDHVPLRLTLSYNLLHGDQLAASPAFSKMVPNSFRLQYRWDKGDIDRYRDLTLQYLQRVNIPDTFANPSTQNIDPAELEDLFRQLTQALLKASDAAIPRVPANHYKHWWDEELDNAKSASISAHRVWSSNGKPKCGPVHDAMSRARREYKILIKTKEKFSQNTFSNDLSDALLDKNIPQFWKTWKAKLGKISSPQLLEDCNTLAHSTDKFANYFETLYQNNTPSMQSKFKQEFDAVYTSYKGAAGVFQITKTDIVNSLLNLKKGKAMGLDGISAEHLLFSHPILIQLLAAFFNVFLCCAFVPESFRSGLLLPVLKNAGLNPTLTDNYRGITISSILSKLFEICLKAIFDGFLRSSDLQFGFKKGLGCRNAIAFARSVIQHHQEGGSTVTVCALDISKAFDKVNFYCLFLKLMKGNVPLAFLNLIMSWYLHCFVLVKWGDFISAPFVVQAGVRQGGVLSPCFFSIYIDEVIIKLRNSGLGCSVRGIYAGCICYADDILLLSTSLYHLQLMINKCVEAILCIDMCLNVKKTFAIRIGSRYRAKCESLTVHNSPIDYVDKLKYLGISILSGRKFACCIDHVKISFYKAFNALYAKAKSASSELICVFLLKSFCLPLLTYALEASDPSLNILSKLDHVVSRAVGKIFQIFDRENVRLVRDFVGLPSIRSVYITALCKFTQNIAFSVSPIDDIVMQMLRPQISRLYKEFCDMNADQSLVVMVKKLLVSVS